MDVPTPDAQTTPAGRVIGTEAARPLEFHVHVGPGQFLQLDDIVAVRRPVPGQSDIELYGVVTEVRGFHEGLEHHSDVERVMAGQMYGRASEVATILTTRIEPEVFLPPIPGNEVHKVAGRQRDKAMFLDKIEPGRRLASGLHRAGGPVFVDADFVDGTSGAHVNISGVSGVATKTSYATFLLHALFHDGSTVLGPSGKHARSLIFNVKGQDLLYLDQPNARLSVEQRARWAEVGLPAQPFGSVAFWSPPVKGAASPTPASARKDKVRAYWWSLADFCAEGMLSLLFADTDDERQQYTAVARNVATALERFATPLAQGGVQIGVEQATTFADLVRIIRDYAEDEDPQWVGRFATSGSIGAFMRRLDSAADHVAHLIRGDQDGWQRHRVRVMSSDEQVNVVDLTPLSGRAQRFVVGALLTQEFAAKEARGTRDPLLFVVLDELNKYAPRQGNSPIKSTLVEIAERGRSLGMILIGAQQTASAVDEAIITNASIKVVGRMDPAEASKNEYRWMPESQRDRAMLINPGTMILKQPRVPAPLVVNFPMPAWATRAEEVAMDVAGAPGLAGGDPFDTDTFTRG
ncbi:ATP-binding protein [Euzebya sp.]|uniref:ATP-binding protein n=1 Tax=Euzebya sp. TaxID=1971409 RepID=UPI003519251B